jgi:hypothetical protein
LRRNRQPDAQVARYRKPLHTDDRKKAEIIRNDFKSAILAGEWNVAVAIDTTPTMQAWRVASKGMLKKYGLIRYSRPQDG